MGFLDFLMGSLSKFALQNLVTCKSLTYECRGAKNLRSVGYLREFLNYQRGPCTRKRTKERFPVPLRTVLKNIT